MCQRAGRVLEQLYEEFGNQRFEIVGIYVAEDLPSRGMELIRRYTSEHGVRFPVVLGERITAVNYLGISPARPQYHVPTFFFVGPEGAIVEERDPDLMSNQSWFGALEANLETSIRRLMPPPPPAAKKAGAKKAGAKRAAATGGAGQGAAKKPAAKAAP